MDATDHPQIRPEPARSAAEAERLRGNPDPASRARAYLDLWERNLVHAAVQGQMAPTRGDVSRV